MAKVGAQRAAELTGKSKSTVQRAMNAGKLSFELDTNGRRVIDVSELERAFGLVPTGGSSPSAAQELEKASALLEMERLKMRVTMLEQQLETAQAQIDDLKAQRDQWQKQASQVLLTSQYSQKQAEELREQIKERQRKVEERRQQKLAMQMKRIRAGNQNRVESPADESLENFNFKGFWQKMKNLA